jgi:hypothetical protein
MFFAVANLTRLSALPAKKGVMWFTISSMGGIQGSLKLDLQAAYSEP